MQPLSKQAEATLIAAIERAAGYVNDGLSPNAAIIKSAAESNIPSGHINLMVHAYNTGRTTKQREQGEDTLEKAADFPLADAATVMGALFPKAVKTAAEISRARVVSTEYAVDPAGLLARRKAAQAKEAAAKISMPEKTWVAPPRDEQLAARKAASDRRAAELAQEELRRQATAAYTKAAAAMEELHEYFRHPGNMSFQDAVRETELRFGAEGVSVLNKLAMVYPHLTKQAATRDMHIGGCAPCELAGKVIGALEAYNAAQARVPVKEAAAKKETPVVVTGSILHNPADEPLVLKSAMPRVMDGGSGRGDYWHMTDLGAPPGGNYLREVDPADYDPDFIGPAPDDQHALFEIPGPKGGPVWIDRAYAAAPSPSWTPPPGGARGGGSGSPPTGGARGGGSGSPPTGGEEEPEDAEFLPEEESASGGGSDGGPPGGGGGGPPGGGHGGGRGATGAGGGQPRRQRNNRGDNRDRDGGGFSLAPARNSVLNAAKWIGDRLATSAVEKQKAMKTKAYQSLTDPEHESALRNIRAQSTLHDLILNDPVISGHDPHDVAQAFNELADVAPQFVDSPAAMQALLRKRLEAGQMADFDVKQLLDMEKARADTTKAQMETKDLERKLI